MAARAVRPLLLVLVASAFIGCLPLPAIRLAGNGEVASGAFLVMGWIGPLQGQLGWYANPLMLLAMIFFAKKKSGHSLLLSSIALVLMLSSLLLGCLVADEGAMCKPVIGHLIGWWLWLASAALLIVGNMIADWIDPGPKRKPRPAGW